MLYCLEENWYLVNYCSREKETVGLLFWRELVSGELLFSGEGNRWSTVLKRTSLLLFSQENEIVGLLFWIKLAQYLSQEKETGGLLFWRELGSIEIARPVCEQLLPDHMTNHEMLWNWMVRMVSWMQLVTTSLSYISRSKRDPSVDS